MPCMLPANVCFWYSCQIWQIRRFVYIVFYWLLCCQAWWESRMIKTTSDTYFLSLFVPRHRVLQWPTLASRFSRRSRPRRTIATSSSTSRMKSLSMSSLQVCGVLLCVPCQFVILYCLSYRRWSRVELRVIFGQTEDHRRQRWEGVPLRSLWLWIHSSVSGNSRGVYLSIK